MNHDPQLLGLLDPLLLALQELRKFGLQFLLLLLLLPQHQLAQNLWALVQDPEVGLAQYAQLHDFFSGHTEKALGSALCSCVHYPVDTLR